MSPHDKEKLNKLEELKNKLFSKNYQTKIEYRDSFSHTKRKEVPETWGNEKKEPVGVKKFFLKTSIFKKFFLFSVGFFVLALAYVAYMFLWGGNVVSNDNISISVFGNTFTNGGEELSLQIEIINKNNTALDLVDLVVEYPRGSEGDLSQDTERIRESLGSILPGAVRNQNMEIVLFGTQGSIRPVRISIEYRVEGTNAIFVKEKLYEVSINSTPIDILVSAPSEVSPNQDITFDIKSSLNSDRTLRDVLLRVDYPVGFVFISALPAPSLGNNVWDVGEMKPGDEYDIKLFGKMVDVFDGEEKTFHISSGLQSSSDKSLIEVVYNSLTHTVMIERPFIAAELLVNGVLDREYATSSQSPIQGQISWVNNLGTKISDLSIRAKISGNAVNRKTIDSQQGFYNSLEDVIIWDKNSHDVFAEVDAGDSGSVAFSLSSLPLFSGIGGILLDPSIKIEVSISAKQPLEGNISKELKNSETKIIRIISDIGFVAKALHFSGTFENTGPIPPKVEEETTYTIVWTLSNTANNVSKTQVRSTLPPWTRFVGPVFPSSEDLTYNPSTKEIVWNAGNIARGAGITSIPKEISFQIALSPSLSQVGEAPVIINNTTLIGHDDFANANARVNKPSLNTDLKNDPGFPLHGARVVE
ncbi:hypothetical protein A2914_00150 [Candidatus Nomurabacteria bacterium RIFCSPLOWO2_01_FULL_41_21]|uniref:DUF11 domain-containing protein n=2 Tax=Candidatus Nomuraibacteriota TaxID=1752729 RepID=A0A1F6V1J0_9BACT|nr:MAG: hypothetical protein A2733_01820 [Candidatus Nomurabacteria bacterium RIFCSPHIGHO2_01_FULL_40_20]OGI88701.1 MAG: hypothetical protein A2914_00150 [Candidatus Nomurabacteria bacterium RIFCSPLOWO2_01_FULL_41_21]